MNITKGFEERVISVADEYTLDYMYGREDVSELLDHTRALEAMLKKNEFNGEGSACPECDNFPHHPDCQLAALLDGVE